MDPLLIQLIGFIALGFALISFQFKDRSKLLLIQVLSASSYVIHFAFLGAWTAAGINGINIVRNLVFRERTKHKWADSFAVPLVFITIYILISVFITWEGMHSLIAIAGVSLGTIRFWFKKTTHIRAASLIAETLWFFYNFTVGSYAGMAANIYTVISAIIGIFRMDMKEFKKKKE